MENLKAVIYARYSSNSQREESIEGQIRDCTAYAERNGYMVIGAYADRAISGTTDDRPEFQKMIKDSKRKQFDLVIVWKLDRFARNRYVSAKYKAQLRQNGVRVISANETISDGAAGILTESILEGMAEWYSENLKENVIRGLSVNAVFVHDDKLLLTFNFKEGTRTITLDDVQTATCSSGSDLDCFVAPKKRSS